MSADDLPESPVKVDGDVAMSDDDDFQLQKTQKMSPKLEDD